MAEILLDFEPQHLVPLESATPALVRVTRTNIIATIAQFDDTTQEYLNGKFTVSDDVNTSGTATFRMSGYSGTAAASKNVAFDFDHAAVAEDEDIDSASYTTELLDDSATINNQNDLEQHEWTETMSALGCGMQVQNLRLMRKEGGESGVWVRGET